jgi:hypothetical protein
MPLTIGRPPVERQQLSASQLLISHIFRNTSLHLRKGRSHALAEIPLETKRSSAKELPIPAIKASA